MNMNTGTNTSAAAGKSGESVNTPRNGSNGINNNTTKTNNTFFDQQMQTLNIRSDSLGYNPDTTEVSKSTLSPTKKMNRKCIGPIPHCSITS